MVMNNKTFAPKGNEYDSIIKFLKTSCKDINMKLCEGCNRSKVYDANGKEYYIVRFSTTIEQAVSLVEKIREINKSVTNA